MRELSQTEKDIIKSLIKLKEKNVKNIFDPLIEDGFFELQPTSRTACYFCQYKTQTKEERNNEDVEILKGIQADIEKKILMVSDLLLLLKLEGYITFHSGTGSQATLIIGKYILNRNDLYQCTIVEERLRSFLKEYSWYGIEPTQELTAYVERGFRTRDDARYRLNKKLSWAAIIIASTLAIISIILSIINKPTAEISQKQLNDLTMSIEGIHLTIIDIKVDQLKMIKSYQDLLNYLKSTNKTSVKQHEKPVEKKASKNDVKKRLRVGSYLFL